MITTLIRALNPNDCGHHDWSDWESKNLSPLRRHTKHKIEDDTVKKKRCYRRYCTHEGCNGEEHTWKTEKEVLRKDFEALFNENFQVVEKRHIPENWLGYYENSDYRV